MTEHDDVDWLSPVEMKAWLGLGGISYLLPQILDAQLRRDFGISHSYYTILAILSTSEDARMTMGTLAQGAWVSPSRLTHAVGKLEERGWVRRFPDPDNGRQQLAELTDDGWDALREMAPSHLGQARRAVFDHLSSDDVAHLARITSSLAEQLREEHRASGSRSS